MSDAQKRPKINIHGHLHHKQDLRERVRIWEEWNVRRFCCACTQPGWLPGCYTNEDFLKVQKEYGDILIGFAAANLRPDALDGPGAVEQYREQGFRGLKFLGNSLPYSCDAYYPIYEKAEELGMPVLFHCGLLGGQGADRREINRDFDIWAENMRPYHFDRIARTFPGLKIIGAHLGWPHQPEALALIEAYENIYFDISGGSGRKPHLRKILSHLLPHPGLDTDWADPQENRALEWFGKLCFGTDNPEPTRWVPASEEILNACRIPEETRERFYYANAAELLDVCGE
jgi:predicted TIM-barrel fold metal-dependent hydrolase